MKRLSLATVLALALILVGCDRASTETTLNAKAGFERRVQLTLAADMMGGEAPTVKDRIRLNGSGWETTSEKKEEGETFTFKRSVASSQAPTVDYTLTGGGQDWMSCTVESKVLPDGNIEYTETYQWLGPKEKETEEEAAKKKEKLAEVYAELKAFGATEAQAKEFSDKLEQRIMRLMFGPNKPMMADLFSQPESTLRRLRSEIYYSTQQIALEMFPSANKDEIAKFAKKLATKVDNSELGTDKPMQKADEAQKKTGEMVMIEGSVAGVGTVVSTNGEIDPVEGRVYWSMYSQACEGAPVVLRAVFKP